MSNKFEPTTLIEIIESISTSYSTILTFKNLDTNKTTKMYFYLTENNHGPILKIGDQITLHSFLHL